jgi:hypothetical protein
MTPSTATAVRADTENRRNGFIDTLVQYRTMDRSHVLAAVSVSVILCVTLLSGPAVGVLDLTRERVDTAGIGEGNVTVDAVDAPDTATFERAVASESYYLEVPAARVHLASVSGRPTLSYRLEIHELGYTRGSTHFLDADDADDGWIAVSLERDTFSGDRITESAYDGTLSVVIRYNDTERVVYEEPVTVAVTG